MRLEKLEIKDFKLEIYKYYKKKFPLSVRKPYSLLKDSYKRGISCFYKILVDDNCVGFIIVNFLDSFKCIILDYLAILPKYQSTKDIVTDKIKEIYDAKLFDNKDVYKTSVGTERQDELFEYANVPTYMKQPIKFNYRDGYDKDDDFDIVF